MNERIIPFKTKAIVLQLINMCVRGDISYASVKQTTPTVGVLNCSVQNTDPSPQICAHFSSITLPQAPSVADAFQQLSLPPLQCKCNGWRCVWVPSHQLIKGRLPGYWNVLKNRVLPWILGCSTTQQRISFPEDVFWCVTKHFVTLLIRLPAWKKPVPYRPRQEAESVHFIQWVWVRFSNSLLKNHFIGDPSCTAQPKLGGRKGEIKDMCQSDGGNKGHMQAKCVWVMLKPSSLWVWD